MNLIKKKSFKFITNNQIFTNARFESYKIRIEVIGCDKSDKFEIQILNYSAIIEKDFKIELSKIK